jgi:CRISPR-associated protein Csa3
VTQPVTDTGLQAGDRLVLLRPSDETDTERAEQAIADVRQLLQKIEPNCEIVTEHIVTESFEETVRECCQVFSTVEPDREFIVSLSGGARDILLPLTVASLVYAQRIDTTLFYSDLNSETREWSLPTLVTSVPDRTFDTFDMLVSVDGWSTLSDVAAETDHSKSTAIRHVNDLEDAGVVESDTSKKAKRVRATFTGELLSIAYQVDRSASN